MILLVGSGGNTADVLSFLTFKDRVFLIDDNKKGEFMGRQIIGTIDDLANNKIVLNTKNTVLFNCIGSVGDNSTRNRIYDRLLKVNYNVQSLVISNTVNKNVYIGKNVFINLGVQIHHDCYIGDNSVICPAAVLCGNVTLKENSFIGAGAVIIQGITVGRNSIVGAGSVVIRDVPPNTKVVGNPAKELV